MDLSHEDVRSILQALENSSVDEFQLKTAELTIIIRKKGAAGKSAADLGGAEQAQPLQREPPPRAEPRAAGHAPVAGGIEIKAPMLGTFYRSPSPGAPPFVEVGGLVAEGDTLCVIEVMKLMNSIRAGASGRVAAILAEDGQMVEYDQTMMVVEPLR